MTQQFQFLEEFQNTEETTEISTEEIPNVGYTQEDFLKDISPDETKAKVKPEQAKLTIKEEKPEMPQVIFDSNDLLASFTKDDEVVKDAAEPPTEMEVIADSQEEVSFMKALTLPQYVFSAEAPQVQMNNQVDLFGLGAAIESKEFTVFGEFGVFNSPIDSGLSLPHSHNYANARRQRGEAKKPKKVSNKNVKERDFSPEAFESQKKIKRVIVPDVINNNANVDETPFHVHSFFQ